MKGLKIINRILGFVSAYLAMDALALFYITSVGKVEIPSEGNAEIIYKYITDFKPYYYKATLVLIGAMCVFLLLSVCFSRLEYHGPKRKRNSGYKRAMVIIGLATIGGGALVAVMLLQAILRGETDYALIPLSIVFVGLMLLLIGIFTPRIENPRYGQYTERVYEGSYCYFSYPVYGKTFYKDELLEIVMALYNEGYTYKGKQKSKLSSDEDIYCYYFRTKNSISKTAFLYKHYSKGDLVNVRPNDFYEESRFEFKPLGDKEEGKITKVRKKFYADVAVQNTSKQVVLQNMEDGEVIEHSRVYKGTYSLFLDGERLVGSDERNDTIDCTDEKPRVVKVEPVFETVDFNAGQGKCYAGPGRYSPSYRQPFAAITGQYMTTHLGYDYYPKNDTTHPTIFTNHRKTLMFGYKPQSGLFFCDRTSGIGDAELTPSKDIFELYIRRNGSTEGSIIITNKGLDVFKYLMGEQNPDSMIYYIKYKKRFFTPTGGDIDYDEPYSFFVDFDDAHFWDVVTNEKTYYKAAEEMWDRKPPQSIIDLLLSIKFLGTARDDRKPTDTEKERYKKLIYKVFEIPKE